MKKHIFKDNKLVKGLNALLNECKSVHDLDVFRQLIDEREKVFNLSGTSDIEKFKSVLIKIQEVDEISNGENFHDAVMRLVNAALEK